MGTPDGRGVGDPGMYVGETVGKSVVDVQDVDDLSKMIVTDLSETLVPALLAKRRFFKNTPLDISL